MDFDQLILLALENNITLLESDTEEDVIRKLQRAGLLQVDVAKEIPDDVIPLIQSFLPGKNIGRSLSTSKAFHQLNRLTIPDVVTWNSTNPIPKYITKVKLGPDVDYLTLMESLHLTYLDLDFNANVSGESISRLYNLKELWIRTNSGKVNGNILEFLDLEILWVDPRMKYLGDGLSFQRNLVKLVFAKVTGSRLKNDDLQNLVKLKELHLGGANLDNEVFKYIPNLEILHLDFNNNITSLTSLKKLRVLYCDGNNMEDEEIAKITWLKELHMEATLNTNKSLMTLTNLEVLETGGSVTDKGIKNLVNLKRLDCRSNHGITIKSLALLPKLEASDIGSVYVKNVGILVNLKHLVVNENVTNEDLKKLVNLRILSLGHNKNITDKGLENLNNLEILNVGIAKITPKAINRLPNLKILILRNFDNFEESDIKSSIQVLRHGIKTGYGLLYKVT